jgi:hypothetical protein
MTIFNSRLDHAHIYVPGDHIYCVKYLIMSRHASLQKSKEIETKSPAPVVPIRIAAEKKSKQPQTTTKSKPDTKLPLYHNERIFKPKKHDPL